MISDDQIMKTQTCFLQEMVQKERIQPSTVDLVHLVPFCLSLPLMPDLCEFLTTKKKHKGLLRSKTLGAGTQAIDRVLQQTCKFN